MKYLHIKVWVITQALAKEYQGIKTNDPDQIRGMYFPTEEDARNYLKQVIMRRKDEVRLGIRNKDNLDPETCLDFAICSAFLCIERTKMDKKEWKLPEDMIKLN